MKTRYIFIVTLLASILMLCTCSDKEKYHPLSKDTLDDIGFKGAYLINFQSDDIYFIKGAALDVYKYGRNIELIEDLKGNFSKETTIFIVWGNGTAPIELNRWDYMPSYKNRDTLLMLLKPAGDLMKFIPKGEPFFEKKGDYTTLSSMHSILKLSNGYVTGYISPWDERPKWWQEDMPQEDMILFLESLSQEERDMLGKETELWDDLQKELQKLLNSTKEAQL